MRPLCRRRALTPWHAFRANQQSPEPVRTSTPSGRSRGSQFPVAELARGFVRVVRATPELQILIRAGAARAERDDMVVFDETCFATATIPVHKRATTFVAGPDSPSHRGWNMARRRWTHTRMPGPCRRRQLGPFHVLEQQRQGPIDNGRRVAVRNLMPQKGTQAFESGERLLVHGDPNEIAFRCEWRDEGPRRPRGSLLRGCQLSPATPLPRTRYPVGAG
jgi:hypothetical protein